MAEIRNGIGDINLQPNGGEIIGNWSFWTDGQLIIGNSDGSSVSSNQQSETYAFTIVLDKPIREN